MAKDLELGFYWVNFQDEWEPAQYLGGEEWQLINSERRWTTLDIKEVGSKITRN